MISFALGKNTAVNGEGRIAIVNVNIYRTTKSKTIQRCYICEGTVGKRRRVKITGYIKDSWRKRGKIK
jgi:hypothetical protein